MFGRRTCKSFATATTPATRFASASPSYFLHIASNELGKTHYTVVHAYRNIGSVYVRIPPEFILDVTSDIAIELYIPSVIYLPSLVILK